MKFDYKYLKNDLCIMEIIMLVIGIFIIVCYLVHIFNKLFFVNNKAKKIVICIFSLIVSSFFLIHSITHLKYGIYLLAEKPVDALTLQGKIVEIKEIRNPFTHDYKYAYRDYGVLNTHAHLITILDKQYYFMIKGDLQVGDNVEIKYLPKSTIVLEVNIIEPEVE